MLFRSVLLLQGCPASPPVVPELQTLAGVHGPSSPPAPLKQIPLAQSPSLGESPICGTLGLQEPFGQSAIELHGAPLAKPPTHTVVVPGGLNSHTVPILYNPSMHTLPLGVWAWQRPSAISKYSREFGSVGSV